MLSFGIQFGQGFDEVTILRMMGTIPKEYDYDLLVIGSNPGGVAFAREARLAGKKTAIITWKNYSPAEAEGFDEDLGEMATALDLPNEEYTENKKSSINSSVAEHRSTSRSLSVLSHKSAPRSEKSGRKVRQSRLDLNNELFKRGQQCRKLMHNAIRLGDLVEDAQNSGWRLTTTRPPLTMNWKKMSEEIMDYVMKENWSLAAELGEECIKVIEGPVFLVDDHTVKIQNSRKDENDITVDTICLALPAECKIPADVAGARKYGITCDDFTRLSESPGKTLVVGSLPESIECAGIMAGCRLPVTVVTRSKILKSCDSEISQMIIDDLRRRGVVFMEDTKLTSVVMTTEKKLMATFEHFVGEEESEKALEETTELFDTVLFAVGRTISQKNLQITDLEIESDPVTNKIWVDSNGKTSVANIYAVGEVLMDCPEDFETSQLNGKILGKRLFHNETEFMSYSMIPQVIYTPTEYAWVGITEDAALYRLGKECVDVYYGYFKPLDFVIPSKKGDCFAKVVVLKFNEEIIGLHIYGPEAGEIIQGFAAAIKNRLTLKNFQTLVGLTGTKAQEILKLKELRTQSKKTEEEVPFLD